METEGESLFHWTSLTSSGVSQVRHDNRYQADMEMHPREERKEIEMM